MRFDLSPWCRSRLTNSDLARFVRRLPGALRMARVQVGRSRAGWGGRLIDRRVLLAQTFDRPTPTAVLDELVRQLAMRSLAWCSECDRPAATELNGEASCASHQPKEAAAA